MTEVRNKGNYEQWIKFFLQAIYESAEDAVETINLLTALHNKNESLIAASGRTAKSIMRVFYYLEANPIIDIKKTALALSVSYNTVAKAVNALMKMEILIQNENTNRNRTFSYEDYLVILRKDT